MDIRQLRDEDFEQKLELSMYAFQYDASAEREEELRKTFKPERVWGAFEGEELQAQLTLLPMQTYINGQVFEMGGIAGVSTWPEHRRQGLVDQLLRHTLQWMKEAGQTVSFLHPFYFPFYRKYGWELYIEYKKYSIPTALLPKKVQTEGQIRRGIQDQEVLASVYAQYASRYNGTLVRDANRWEVAVLKPEGLKTAVYYDEHEAARGYVLYTVKERELNIRELVYLDEQARRALWTYIANHDSMVDQVKLQAPADDALPYLLHDPRIEQQIVPYFMARIVSVKDFVEQYPFEKGIVENIRIDVEDSICEWNQGIWDVLINEDGHAQVVRHDGLPDGVQDDIQQYSGVQLDIQALTSILMGYKRPVELHQWEKIGGKAEAVELLERRIPRRETYLMDFF
ncbi:enhanced intracellular survival protein Eis [Paenibacillus sp. WLX1005]|uniref:GNAT family N-acetyltransferase n=1 Tax=Paenibacillus sp. WLX1005 TaxID=3243766 RepID=UPI0039843ABB